MEIKGLGLRASGAEGLHHRLPLLHDGPSQSQTLKSPLPEPQKYVEQWPLGLFLRVVGAIMLPTLGVQVNPKP